MSHSLIWIITDVVTAAFVYTSFHFFTFKLLSDLSLCCVQWQSGEFALNTYRVHTVHPGAKVFTPCYFRSSSFYESPSSLRHRDDGLLLFEETWPKHGDAAVLSVVSAGTRRATRVSEWSLYSVWSSPESKMKKSGYNEENCVSQGFKSSAWVTTGGRCLQIHWGQRELSCTSFYLLLCLVCTFVCRRPRGDQVKLHCRCWL